MASVNKPFDEAKKEVDINQKLQLYGILTGFRNGKLPSNDQIDVALNSFLASNALANPSDKLSAEGKGLIEDVREVVKLAKHLLLSKNKDNLLQEFIWQTRQFDPSSVATPNAPISKEAAKNHGRDVLDGLRTLGTLIISNGQFRKLLKDATALFRDMASDAAITAADRIRPSDRQLQQIDHAAEDHTWHDTPDLSAKNIKQQIQNVYNGNPAEDARSAADAALLESGAQSGNGLGGLQYRAGAAAAADTFTQRVDDNLDQDTADRVKASSEEYKRRLRDYMRKKMPEERRGQTLWRLKKMVLECQQHPDYSQAVQTLLDLAEEYGRHGRNMVRDTSDTAQDTRSGLSHAEANLKTLIERFANGTSTDPLWDSVNQIYSDANQDNELKTWFKSLDRFIRRCLLEQGYVLDDTSTSEWNRIYDHGRYLMREKYSAHTDRVVDEVRFLFEQFGQDPQNQAFGQAVQRLFEDLGNDESGKPTFKPHLVKDLRDVILPALFEGVSYVPVPRIEYSDSKVDAVIENLVLESDNFMPNVLEVHSESDLKWARKNEASSVRQMIEVKVKGIQLDVRNVCYYVNHKTGFPNMSDQGSADIFLPGDGFSLKIRMDTAEDDDWQNYFKVEKVDVSLKRLQIKIVESRHKLLFSLVRPLMLRALRPALQKAIEKAIKDQMSRLDAVVWEIKQEADRAKGAASDSDEAPPNAYSRYVSATQKHLLQGKKGKKGTTTPPTAAETAAAQAKKVNVAVTQQESMLPDVVLAGGISTKATEYRQMASEGRRWESPVFSVGSAARSTDIPDTPVVQRKPHPTAVQNGARPYEAQNGRGAAYPPPQGQNGQLGGAYADYTLPALQESVPIHT